MDSEMTRAHGHHYDENPGNNSTLGEEQVHHEKTSVLKKVKAKARKIKDQLGLKSHSHTHDQDEEEESDDAYEQQLVQDPQIHAAPLHESAAAKNFAAGQEGSAGQSKVHLDQKSPHFSDNQDQNVCPGTFQTKITDPGVPAEPLHNSPESRNFATGHDINSGQSNVSLGEHLGEDAPKHRGGEDVSPASYQTKVTDTGAGGREEPGVSPILHSFDKMNIHDEPRHKKESTTTGSHDQFTPSPSPNFDSNKPNTSPENAPSFPKSFNASTENHPQDAPSVPESFNASTENHPQDAPSVPESVNASTENHPQDAPSVPESFNASTENHPQDMNVDEPTTHQSGYTDRISSVTTALADKAISAKNVVASKIGYGGNDGNASAGMQKDNGGENVMSAGKPIASTDDLNAADPSKQQNTYTEKFSSVTYAMADKAVSAKNVVASKLGYGGSENTAAVGSEVNKGEDNVKTGGGVTGYGRQIASTVTEKLAPVYGTVAEVGSAVLSKMPGTGTHKDNDTTAPKETERGVVGETDVGSMKGYLAEKLKPGEEDKALSQVISDALHKCKGGEERKEEKRPVGEVVSDAFHKRNDDEDMPRDDKPMGKVTESEEVANRLGSSETERLGKVSGSESPGKGVVDKFKGAFTNWFGKGGETNPSQAFNDHSLSQGTKEEQGMAREGGENVSSEGERKLQESSN